ncbi:MAG: TonB family protein [Caulobacterales bacterium]|nr:TonB family protein [Caulobacterales bacterium]
MISVLLAALMQAASPTASVGSVAKPFKCPVWSGTLYYPERAAWKRVEGQAVVNCAVSSSGRLSDCRVLNETPGGWGFGQAAVVMAQCLMQGEHQPAGRADVPITFKLPPTPDDGALR